jgi:hypothetical protein
MRRCAFLTMDNTSGFVFDDDLAVEPLRSLGWDVSFVSWNDPGGRWDRFDVAIPRTTWDYHHHLERFLTVLGIIDSQTLLANSLPLIRWNAHKSYLLDLAQRGVPIVPTIRGTSLSQESLDALRNQLNSETIVVKPLVGANADFTFPLRSDATRELHDEAFTVFGEREFLAQGFMENITKEGEYSLFYFNGELSHAILKTPRQGDFRVQEEHGGVIKAAEPERSLLTSGRRVMDALTEVPLYARTDFVRGEGGEFCLMELELIEPALYLRMDRTAPGRFALAVNQWMVKMEKSR